MKSRVIARRMASQMTRMHRGRDRAPRPMQTKHPRSSHQRPPMFRPHRDPHPASHPVCALLRQRKTYLDCPDHLQSRVVCRTSLVAGQRRPDLLRRRARFRPHQRPRAQLLERPEEGKSARRHHRALPRRRRLRLSGELVASARLVRAVRRQLARRQRIRRLLLPRRREG